MSARKTEREGESERAREMRSIFIHPISTNKPRYIYLIPLGIRIVLQNNDANA